MNHCRRSTPGRPWQRLSPILGFPALVALCLALQGCSAPEEVGPDWMSDPLFGLSYSLDQAHFQKLDSRAVHDSGLEHPPYFVYAHDHSESEAVWVLNHWVPTGDPTARIPQPEPSFGIVLIRSNATYRVMGTPDHLFDNPDWLDATSLQRLLDDAAHRYINAFGGSGALAGWLSEDPADCTPADPRLVKAFLRNEVALPPACTDRAPD